MRYQTEYAREVCKVRTPYRIQFPDWFCPHPPAAFPTWIRFSPLAEFRGRAFLGCAAVLIPGLDVDLEYTLEARRPVHGDAALGGSFRLIEPSFARACRGYLLPQSADGDDDPVEAARPR